MLDDEMDRRHRKRLARMERAAGFESVKPVSGFDSAALDRLTHHARITVITGESYRQKSRRKENQTQQKPVSQTMRISLPADRPFRFMPTRDFGDVDHRFRNVTTT